MDYVIGLISLLFWIMSILAGFKAFDEGDCGQMNRCEWYSIAYLAIAAYCFA